MTYLDREETTKLYFGNEDFRIKMAVFCRDANGEPDIFFCRVETTPQEIDNGDHYIKAIALAVKEGYEDCRLACDVMDKAGAVMQLCHWETIP